MKGETSSRQNVKTLINAQFDSLASLIQENKNETQKEIHNISERVQDLHLMLEQSVKYQSTMNGRLVKNEQVVHETLVLLEKLKAEQRSCSENQKMLQKNLEETDFNVKKIHDTTRVCRWSERNWKYSVPIILTIVTFPDYILMAFGNIIEYFRNLKL